MTIIIDCSSQKKCEKKEEENEKDSMSRSNMNLKKVEA